MTGTPRLHLLALLCIALQVACAPTRPDAYLRARAAAERAYGHGRYEQAAAHWRAAAAHADRERDRDDAAYREAASLKRAGRIADASAALDRIVNAAPGSRRAPRAAYDRARIEIRHGDEAKGYHMLDHMLRAHPDSGVAPSALRHYLDWLTRTDPERVLPYLEERLAELRGTELAQHAEYARARTLERQGALERALAQYVDIAKRYPYPKGPLWDDALWHAAAIEVRLGRPEEAVRHLERLLSERESSRFAGSYERGRYAEARYRIAELYRDELGDPRRAAREFAKVFSDHPTSLLRDDAKWAEARLASRLGDPTRACRALEELVAAVPKSRYAHCTDRLCPTLRPPPGATCRRYILRQLGDTPTSAATEGSP